MITITDAARLRLAVMLDELEARREQAVRISYGLNGPELTIDMARPGDQHFDYLGKCVGVIDACAAMELSDVLIDVDDLEVTPRFAFV